LPPFERSSKESRWLGRLQRWLSDLGIIYILVYFCHVAARCLALMLSDVESNRSVVLGAYHGLGTDAVVAFIIAFFIRLLPYWRYSIFIFVLILAYLLSANIEYILVNSSNLPLGLIGVGLDTDWVISSSVNYSTMSHLAVIYAVFLGMYFLLRTSYLQAVFTLPWIAVFVVLTMGLLAVPKQSVNDWVQLHPLIQNYQEFYPSGKKSQLPLTVLTLSEIKPYRDKDVSGAPLVVMPNLSRPNVLIITLESLSQSMLDQGWMPNTQALASQMLYYPNLVEFNRLTTNGIYAMLCGDYPTFIFRMPWYNRMIRPTMVVDQLKTSQMAHTSQERDCLPARLKREGYQTVYMQAAYLSFMRKQDYVPQFGFEQTLGSRQLPAVKDKNKASWWGPNDRVFLTNFVPQKIRELQSKNKPWLLYALTVGTHHPFRLYEDFNKGERNAKKRTFQFLDLQIKRLMEVLEEMDVLQNTLIILVSDESAAPIHSSEPQELLKGIHGFLMIHTPGAAHAQIDQLTLHSDLYTSVLDYLGLPVGGDIYMGRSVFRQNTHFRPVLAADAYQGYVYNMNSPNELMICKLLNLNCRTFKVNDGQLFTENYPEMPVDETKIPKIISLIRYFDKNLVP
jgi:arylsulfatase A-like enzyme